MWLAIYIIHVWSWEMEVVLMREAKLLEIINGSDSVRSISSDGSHDGSWKFIPNLWNAHVSTILKLKSGWEQRLRISVDSINPHIMVLIVFYVLSLFNTCLGCRIDIPSIAKHVGNISIITEWQFLFQPEIHCCSAAAQYEDVDNTELY